MTSQTWKQAQAVQRYPRVAGPLRRLRLPARYPRASSRTGLPLPPALPRGWLSSSWTAVVSRTGLDEDRSLRLNVRLLH